MKLSELTDALPGMTIAETKGLRDMLTKDLQNKKRRKSKSITVYVQAEFRDAYEIAKSWAHEKNLTKKKTDWAFAKFAITNTIQMILEEKERERNAPAEVVETVEVPQEPS